MAAMRGHPYPRGKGALMYFVLLYDYVDDVAERRPQFREEHLSAVSAHVERGEIIMAGAWANPMDGAAVVFRCEDRSLAERFVEHDPYVKNGLVPSWRIREWTVVAGTALE